MHALVEQPGRAATRETLGDERSPSASRRGQLTAASLAEHIGRGASEALGGHAFDVGWKRGTLWTA
eukprot:2713131-Prymnesium_polylepis.1